MISETYNMDCLNYMSGLPDNAFELAIVDPPYGIGEDGLRNHSRGKLTLPTFYKPYSSGDKEPPSSRMIAEFRRVSRNQIIWGANHYMDAFCLPISASAWVVWNKENGLNDFADCELAWTSFDSAVRCFTFRWLGMLQGNMSKKEKRLHPNQKPVALYKWLLQNYAKEGDKILDTHLGSGSSRIACYDLGFDFVGTELDKDYFEAQEKRFANHIQQPRSVRT